MNVMTTLPAVTIANRFRGFLPVVVDVETGGLQPEQDALLEIAASTIQMDAKGCFSLKSTVSAHIEPAAGLTLNPDSMKINGINLDSPFRFAVSEKQALTKVFDWVKEEIKQAGCTRAILVGHNAHFDLAFLNAAIRRTQISKSPFHLFSCLDTVSLSALMFGQTVLAKACMSAGIEWNASDAHSALYDTEKTAELFCYILNRWQDKVGFTASQG